MRNLNQLLAGRKVRVSGSSSTRCEGTLLMMDPGYVLVAVEGKEGLVHEVIPSTSILKIRLMEPLITEPTVQERLSLLKAMGSLVDRLSGHYLTKQGLGECDDQLRRMQVLLEQYFAGQSRE